MKIQWAWDVSEGQNKNHPYSDTYKVFLIELFGSNQGGLLDWDHTGSWARTKQYLQTKSKQ